MRDHGRRLFIRDRGVLERHPPRIGEGRAGARVEAALVRRSAHAVDRRHRLPHQRRQRRVERAFRLGAEIGVMAGEHRIGGQRGADGALPCRGHSAASSTAGVGSTVRSITSGSSPIVISALASARNSVTPSPSSAI
jgi:hypothetical protein